MAKPKIGVIIGSTRPGRFGDKPAEWVAELAKATGEFDVEIIDLRDFPLPFFDEQASPAWAPSQADGAKAWQDKVASLDGYIITAAEYNRSPTGVLKNALDYAYNEWNNKPVAFVGYGGVGGARAVEQLRLISVELQMSPIRNGVHIVWADYAQVASGDKKLSDFAHLNQAAGDMLKQFSWWVKALKTARDNDTATAKAA
ncbi:NAD(P)H-dependent oxidoreductase [Mesorhizobium microcysteis]|uniref:NAD(P)H-dependent oxidoreductase n=1 Tax=Neoaquamicrobium microcysteis TaxID=2682781 RepID=A0A5D4GQ74_9HYPH|nr:NAD(P)H-dependent oxidoreductase [Mesorhizobium microcysteis]TYR30478.1 NAD(P)H-dependent oxidoreductase [Mesorhizobium microcysteis]